MHTSGVGYRQEGSERTTKPSLISTYLPAKEAKGGLLLGEQVTQTGHGPVISYFSCFGYKIPDKSNLRKDRVFGVIVQAYSPSWLGGHGSRM